MSDTFLTKTASDILSTNVNGFEAINKSLRKVRRLSDKQELALSKMREVLSDYEDIDVEAKISEYKAMALSVGEISLLEMQELSNHQDDDLKFLQLASLAIWGVEDKLVIWNVDNSDMINIFPATKRKVKAR